MINISDDFSDSPGGRYEFDGNHSGEAFRTNVLQPMYLQAARKKEKLIVDFDRTFGYATSFLEEAFGGLVRDLKVKGILNHIEIVSNDDITVPGLINKYVEKAEGSLE